MISNLTNIQMMLLYNLLTIKKINIENQMEINVSLFKIIPVFYANYIYENNQIFINRLYCERNFRRAGICTYIISHIKNEAKKKNIEQIALNVYKENFEAINCYKKNGFTHRLNSEMICRIE